MTNHRDFTDVDNTGAKLIDAGQFREAMPYVDQSARTNPSIITLGNLGICLWRLGRPADAEIAFRRVIALDPNNVIMQYNLAFALLSQGKYEEGWRQVAWRKRLPRWNTEGEPFRNVPTWTGQPLSDTKILAIYHEQGLGDALMLMRYVTQVQRIVPNVCLIGAPSLDRLFGSVFATPTYTPLSAPRVHFQCSIFDLPALCGITIDTVPRKPYLHADPTDVAAWASKMACLPPGLRVGLVWAGAKRAAHYLTDARRSLSLHQLDVLFETTKGVNFVSLQMGEATAQLCDFPMIHDWMGEIHDFADTAALIANLDLVISVDTSVAHLAGAMGIPVWLLNRHDACWRWFDRQKPWYGDNMREFRQSDYGNWTSVIEDVREALQATIAK